MAEKAGAGQAPPAEKDPPVHRAEDLMEGGRAALISLGDRFYSLRITRAGKLILTR